MSSVTDQIKGHTLFWLEFRSAPKKALDISIIAAALLLCGGAILLGAQSLRPCNFLAKLNPAAKALKVGWFGIAAVPLVFLAGYEAYAVRN